MEYEPVNGSLLVQKKEEKRCCFLFKKHITKHPFSLVHSIVEVALLIAAAVLIHHIVSNGVEVDKLQSDIQRVTFQMGNLSGFVIGLQSTFISLQSSVFSLKKELDVIENMTSRLQLVLNETEAIGAKVDQAQEQISAWVTQITTLLNQTQSEIRTWVEAYNVSNLIVKRDFEAFAQNVSIRLSNLDNRTSWTDVSLTSVDDFDVNAIYQAKLVNGQWDSQFVVLPSLLMIVLPGQPKEWCIINSSSKNVCKQASNPDFPIFGLRYVRPSNDQAE